MSGTLIEASMVDALALPRIVWLRPNLVGLVFPLMKLLPARFIVRKALEEGRLRPGGLIAETTSGTFGLALAMVARLQGLRLTLVSDPAIDAPLRRRLEDLGATVHIVREPGPTGGFQQARLAVLERVLAENPGSFCPRQYDNPHNPGSYAPCAEQLAHAAGAVDCLIGTVGSGGSMCGISSYLRLIFPELVAVGIDTHRSVIFGQSDAGSGRALRGLGNSLMPPTWTTPPSTGCTGWAPPRRSAPPASCTAGTRSSPAPPAAPPGWWRTGGRARTPTRWGRWSSPTRGTATRTPSTTTPGWRRRGSASTPSPAGRWSGTGRTTGDDPWARHHWGRRTFAEVMGEPAPVLERVGG